MHVSMSMPDEQQRQIDLARLAGLTRDPRISDAEEIEGFRCERVVTDQLMVLVDACRNRGVPQEAVASVLRGLIRELEAGEWTVPAKEELMSADWRASVSRNVSRRLTYA